MAIDTTTPILPVPRFVHAQTYGYEMQTTDYEDGSEQRLLTSSGYALSLVYQYGTVDSATMSDVRSIFLDAQQSATVFTAIDYRTGQLRRVYFEAEALTVERNGVNFRIGAIPLRVVP